MEIHRHPPQPGSEKTMIVDFQCHYTPPELQIGRNDISARLDENGNPNYLLNPLLADLDRHISVMDAAGIDAAVLSSGPGFDQPDLEICRIINDRIAEAERHYPGRFIGLAHVPALDPRQALPELKRCAIDLGFPGVVIGSELQGQPLDAEALRPFWKAVADLGLYVFVHPLPAVIAWDRMDADDLGRMVGWEFSLMVATIRLINGRVLDDLPHLRVQFAHFSGGIGRYLGRIRGFQQRDQWGTSDVPRHNRRPALPFDHYLEQRLYYDCAGWAGPDHAGAWGAEWVRFGMQEVAFSQVVFATDYPQAVREASEVADYVKAVRDLSPDCRAMLNGANAAKLIPDIAARLARSKRAAKL
jgi:predicted TIM-barrel fold metal-dependent hydrolase